MSIECHRPRGTLPSFALGTSKLPWAGVGRWDNMRAHLWTFLRTFSRTFSRTGSAQRDPLTGCLDRYPALDS